jgi:AcrR family transcriptional regulator
MQSSGMQTLRYRQKQGRTEAILKAATRLFRTQGYEQTSINDIADAAELSVGTLYNYFSGKAGIAFAIYESDRRIVREREQQVIADAALDPLERLARFIEADVFCGFNEIDLQTWSEIEAMSLIRSSGLSAKILQINAEIVVAAESLLKRMISEGVLDAAVATLPLARLMFYIGRVHCLQLMSQVQTDNNSVRKLIREEVQAVFQRMVVGK